MPQVAPAVTEYDLRPCCEDCGCLAGAACFLLVSDESLLCVLNRGFCVPVAQVSSDAYVAGDVIAGRLVTTPGSQVPVEPAAPLALSLLVSRGLARVLVSFSML